MLDGKILARVMAALAVFIASLIMAPTAISQTQTVLFSFGHTAVGPTSLLTFDAAGNLYGTTQSGGFYGEGTVFELSPKAGGGWSEKILHNFGNAKDGTSALSGVILDAAGNLYGTAASGGEYGYGMVFELSPQSDGRWAEKILHNFNHNGKDGNTPYGGLVLDAAGNLYGAASAGGAYGSADSSTGGTVFELSYEAGRGWNEKILHNFGSGEDGDYPMGYLIFDSEGNLYGTTTFGGHSSVGCNPQSRFTCGTIFELSPRPTGNWSEKVLHSFGNEGVDGNFPSGGLVFDKTGNLYGTASQGGTRCNCGAIFEISPTVDGHWTEKVLHNFGSTRADGTNPQSALTFDGAGNLYGTTPEGPGTGGVVFELMPAADGTWTETFLYTFKTPSQGIAPVGGVIWDSAGNLYGATFDGGANGDGSVYEITR
jgi:uncharacterized repeat protein (TIGR03803 family)